MTQFSFLHNVKFKEWDVEFIFFYLNTEFKDATFPERAFILQTVLTAKAQHNKLSTKAKSIKNKIIDEN